MAKTFTSNLPSVSTGDVLTATAQNNLLTTLNSHTVPPMCRVYNSATLTPYTTNTAITWNSESYDTDAMHDTGSNTSRITFQTAGVYLCTATIRVDATTVTQANLFAKINGAASPQLGQNLIGGLTTTYAGQISSFMYSFSAGDYLEWVQAWTGTGTGSINASSSAEFVFMGKTA